MNIIRLAAAITDQRGGVKGTGRNGFQLILRSQPRAGSTAVWVQIIAKCEQRQLADEIKRQCRDMPPKRLLRQPSHQSVMIMY